MKNFVVSSSCSEDTSHTHAPNDFAQLFWAPKIWIDDKTSTNVETWFPRNRIIWIFNSKMILARKSTGNVDFRFEKPPGFYQAEEIHQMLPKALRVIKKTFNFWSLSICYATSLLPLLH